MKIYVVCENAFQTPLYDIAMYTNINEAINTAIAMSNYKQSNTIVIAFEKKQGIAQMQYNGIETVCHKGKIIK